MYDARSHFSLDPIKLQSGTRVALKWTLWLSVKEVLKVLVLYESFYIQYKLQAPAIFMTPEYIRKNIHTHIVILTFGRGTLDCFGELKRVEEQLPTRNHNNCAE